MPTKLERLQRAIPKIFTPNINPFIKELLTAWANELEEVQVNIDEAKNQIFVELASGNFLNDLGKNVDVYRPAFVTLEDGTRELIPGLADDEFRKLIPVLSFYPKQIKKTMLSALDIFWGPTYTRATVTSGNSEFYNLLALGFPCELSITIDKIHDIKITFEHSDFANAANATVDEIIEVINNTTDKLTALKYYNNETSSNYIRIYTNTAGTTGSIQINTPTGVDANAAFGFSTLIKQFIKVGIYELINKEIVFRVPEQIPILLDELKGSHHFHEDSHDFYISSWSNGEYVKSFNYYDHEQRLSVGGALGSGVNDFNGPHGIHIDKDYIYICDVFNQRIIKRKRRDFEFISQANNFGGVPLGFAFGITGDDTFLYITDSSNNEVIKIRKVDLGFDSRYGVAGAGINQLNMPWGIVYSNGYIYICDRGNDRIMQRLASDLSYVNHIGTTGAGVDQFNNPFDIAADIDDYIYVFDFGNNRVVKRRQIDLAYVSQAVFNNGASICYDEATNNLLLVEALLANNLNIKYWDLDLNEFNSVLLTNIGLPGHCGIACSPANRAFNSILNTDWPGSFMYDSRQLVNSFTITSKRTYLAQNLFKNNIYTTIAVDNAGDFSEDGGYLVFNYAKSSQEQLVPYLGKPNPTTLTIHPAYKFEYDHNIGERVNIVEKGNYIPDGTGTDYPVYLINPNVARELVTMLVNLVKAAGVRLRFEIDITEYKYDYLNNL